MLDRLVLELPNCTLAVMRQRIVLGKLNTVVWTKNLVDDQIGFELSR